MYSSPSRAITVASVFPMYQQVGDTEEPSLGCPRLRGRGPAALEIAKVSISTVENLFFSWLEGGAVQIYWLHPRMLTTTEDQIIQIYVMKN